MIDVIFLLLIFFALTSNFKKPEKSLPTKLNGIGAINATTQTQEERDLDKIVARVVVDGSGRVAFAINGTPKDSLEQVEETFRELQSVAPEAPVVVDPDGNVSLESVLDVYDAARRSGLSTVKFAASPEALAQ